MTNDQPLSAQGSICIPYLSRSFATILSHTAPPPGKHNSPSFPPNAALFVFFLPSSPTLSTPRATQPSPNHQRHHAAIRIKKERRATEQDSVTRHPCEYPIRRPINPAPRVHARYGAQTRPVRSPRQSRTCWLRCLSLPRPAATYSSLCPSAAPRLRSRHEPWPPVPER